MLEKHLSIQAAAVDKRRAVSFADVCADTLTPGTAKARIMLLKSAWEWGRGRYELADDLTGRQVAWKVDGEGSLDKSLEKR
jgi:hypothetical protein